eukprot:4983015-Ditylum_brightwellii.AAC.1
MVKPNLTSQSSNVPCTSLLVAQIVRFRCCCYWGYNFYIRGTILSRFYKPVTLVWPVLNQRLEVETHCGGDREPGVKRDLHIHIPNPEFAHQIILVTVGHADTLLDVRTKLVGVIVETMFHDDYVFRVGSEIIARHQERERLAWPIFCDIITLVPCHILLDETPENVKELPRETLCRAVVNQQPTRGP